MKWNMLIHLLSSIRVYPAANILAQGIAYVVTVSNAVEVLDIPYLYYIVLGTATVIRWLSGTPPWEHHHSAAGHSTSTAWGPPCCTNKDRKSQHREVSSCLLVQKSTTLRE